MNFRPSNNLLGKMLKQKSETLTGLSASIEQLSSDLLAKQVFNGQELIFFKEVSARLLQIACDKEEHARELEK